MYFGRAGTIVRWKVVLRRLSGHQFGVEGADNTLPFTHFTRWVAAHYRVMMARRAAFTLIREHVGGEERLAFY